METFDLFAREPSSGQTSSPAASHVKTLVMREQAQGLRAPGADCGQRSSELLATLDLTTQSWRTFQRCLLEGLGRFCEIWPRSGMTRNGIAYRLPTLAPGTAGTEYGFLPTPRATARGSPKNRYFGSAIYKSNLEEALRNGPDDPIYQNPVFVEKLMGYPEGWTEIDASATPSSRKSRKSSGGQS